MDGGNGTKGINHKDDEEEEEAGAAGSTFFKPLLAGLISDKRWCRRMV